MMAFAFIGLVRIMASPEKTVVARPAPRGTGRPITSPHGDNGIRPRNATSGGGSYCWNETRKRTLSYACSGRLSAAFVHDLAGCRKHLMLDRSLQIEFENYRKTLSSADRLAFDESIERLVSQHGIDYVRGYVDALKERGSQ